MSIGFLEIGAIFNPGSKHVVEEKQREKMEVRKEGELFDPPEYDIDTDMDNEAKTKEWSRLGKHIKITLVLST